MKKLLLSSAAALAISSTAWAADPVVFEEVVVVAPADIWDGLFIGVIGGYGWANDGLDVHSYSYHDMEIKRKMRRKHGGESQQAISELADAVEEQEREYWTKFLSDDDEAWASDTGDGWWGGLVVGFNVQNGNFVFGAEADINFSDIDIGSQSVSTLASVSYTPDCEFYTKGKVTNCDEWEPREPRNRLRKKKKVEVEDGEDRVPPAKFPLDGSTGSRTSANAQVDWYGTARLKAGYAVDNVMAYVTGGLAFGEVKLNGTVDTMHSFGNGDVSYQSVGFTDSSTEVGFVLGGGVDFAVTPNFIVGAFYRYVDLGSVSGGGTNTDSRSYKAVAHRPGCGAPGALSCDVQEQPQYRRGKKAKVHENGEGSGSASADANFHTVGLRAVFKFDSLFNN